MIKLIVGQKGLGKTKKLIDMANSAAKTSDGHVVFIDRDKQHIYDLHYDVRFVETENFPLSNYRELVGFVCGILSQDNDIKEIFVDGLTKVIHDIDNDGLLKLCKKFETLSQTNEVDFVMSMNCDAETLPDELKSLTI